MNKIISKTLSLILAAVFIASVFTMPAFADDTEVVASASDAQYAVELLNALGITDVASSANLDEKVSREEFAALLTRFVGLQNVTVNSNVKFKDVLSGSLYEAEITTVVASGYMQAVTEDYFYPAWEITATDAARAFLLCLGYEGVASSEQMFTNFANRLDIYDGVATSNFTRGEVYKMMYNALMANVMDQTGFGEDVIYEQLKDINGLYRFHDVIRTEGTITGAEGVSLGSGNKSTLEDGIVELDGVRFAFAGQDMSTILGREVYLYWTDVRGSNIDHAIHVEVIDDTAMVLTSEDIVGYADKTYSYEENDKIKTKTLNSPYVVYNGEEYMGAYTKDIMYPENGDVTIVENVGTKGNDLVIIRSFTDVLVNFIINDDEQQTILGKNGERFDVGLYENGAKYYDADGFPLGLSDIKADTVISVAQSSTGAKTTIYAGLETINGQITLRDSDIWTIGETEYKLTTALKNRISSGKEEVPEFNKNYNFYLNCNGEIAFVGDGASALEDGVFYGVVTGRSSGSGFDTEVGIKVFSKTMGGFETYAIADKLELNGKRAESTDVIAALNKNGRDGLATNEFIAQPVKIGLNDENEVIYLMQAASSNDDGLGFFYFMGSTDPARTGTYYQYRNVLSYSKMGGHDFAAAPKDDGYLQAGMITSTETIQVPFFVPENGAYMGKIDVDSEKAFISSTRPSGNVPFLVYKEDDEDLAASFIIRAVEAGEKEHCETTVNVHCILSITERVVDGEVVTCIKTNKMTYYLDNPEINLNALKIWDTLEKPDAVVPWIDPATGVQGVHKVVPGDLVNIAADATGFIKAMEIVYDSTNNRMMGKGTGTGASYGYINSDTIWYSRNTEYNITLLHVLKIEDGYISATNAKDPADYIADPDSARHYLGVVPPIICVEESGTKLTSRNAVNSDLIGYYDSPEDHATVLLMHRYAQQQGTSFVIKK